jgi:hypothetical protein
MLQFSKEGQLLRLAIVAVYKLQFVAGCKVNTLRSGQAGSHIKTPSGSAVILALGSQYYQSVWVRHRLTRGHCHLCFRHRQETHQLYSHARRHSPVPVAEMPGQPSCSVSRIACQHGTTTLCQLRTAPQYPVDSQFKPTAVRTSGLTQPELPRRPIPPRWRPNNRIVPRGRPWRRPLLRAFATQPAPLLLACFSLRVRHTARRTTTADRQVCNPSPQEPTWLTRHCSSPWLFWLLSFLHWC